MTLLFITFAGLLIIGVPIAFSMMGASLLFVYVYDYPLTIVIQRIESSVQAFPLLAVLLFTLAGALMNETGISHRLFDFTRSLIGHRRGGLAQTAVVGNIFLSGVSGSSVADCAATSKIFVPQLVKAGYHRGFAAAICASCSTLAPIIPPSILMVLYAWQANVSLGSLFWAGVIPGLLLALSLVVVTAIIARRRGYPADAPFNKARVKASFKYAIWALIMPVLILVGFRMGVFTATEIAGVICAYAFGLGTLVYKSLGLAATTRVLLATAKDTAALLMLVAGAAPLAWILGISGTPQLISDSLQAMTSDPLVVLLLLNGVLLIMGLVMETLALLIILVPILAPVLEGYGVDMVHFGIVLLVNLTIGQLTPPIGILVFVASMISKVPVRQLFWEILPMLAALIGMLLLFTFVPAISLWLPNLMM